MYLTPRAKIRICIAITAVLGCALTAAELCWIWADRSVWSFDPSWYGEVSLRLFAALRDAGTSWWFREMMAAFGTKAPLIAWLGQAFAPLAPLTGTYERALLLLPLAASVCSLAAMMWYAALVFGARALPVAAAGLIAAGAPLFRGLSHQFYTEPLQLWTAAMFFLLLASKASARTTVECAVALGSIGLLAKASTPIYVVAPAAVLLIELPLRFRSERTPSHPLLTAAALCTAAMCCAWYWSNWPTLTTFLHSASVGDFSSLYGAHASFAKKAGYWCIMFAQSFFGSIWQCAVWLALVIYLLVRAECGRAKFTALAAAVQIIGVLAVLSAQTNEDSRYLLALLPSVAALSAFAASRALPAAIVIVMLGCAGIIRIGAHPKGITPLLFPANPDERARVMLHAAVVRTCTGADRGRTSIVGQEIDSFNANSASFYMAQLLAENAAAPFCFYRSLGYAERDPARAWERMQALDPAFVVFRRDLSVSDSDPFNAVSNAMHARLVESPLFAAESDAVYPELEFFRRKERS
jgi:hypothetical protein